jgi:hypothetical protein
MRDYARNIAYCLAIRQAKRSKLDKIEAAIELIDPAPAKAS